MFLSEFRYIYGMVFFCHHLYSHVYVDVLWSCFCSRWEYQGLGDRTRPMSGYLGLLFLFLRFYIYNSVNFGLSLQKIISVLFIKYSVPDRINGLNILLPIMIKRLMNCWILICPQDVHLDRSFQNICFSGKKHSTYRCTRLWEKAGMWPVPVKHFEGISLG